MGILGFDKFLESNYPSVRKRFIVPLHHQQLQQQQQQQQRGAGAAAHPNASATAATLSSSSSSSSSHHVPLQPFSLPRDLYVDHLFVDLNNLLHPLVPHKQTHLSLSHL